jgi:hypothetical protein
LGSQAERIGIAHDKENKSKKIVITVRRESRIVECHEGYDY